MNIRDRAKVAMTDAFYKAAEHYQKKNKLKITKSWFKRHFGSSAYHPHQNDQEKAKRLRNYPSMDLSKYRR